MKKRRIRLIGVACAIVLVTLLVAAEDGMNGANTHDCEKKRLIVGFDEQVDRTEKTAVHHEVGARFIREFSSIAADVVVVTSRLSVAEAILKYQQDVRVRYAERDQVVSLRRSKIVEAVLEESGDRKE